MDTPPNTTVTFNLDLADQYDNTYHLEYTTRVLEDDVQLALEEFVISDDSNRDGVLSPGERARVSRLVFRNDGASDIRGLTGIISTDSPHISFDADSDLSFEPDYCGSSNTCGRWTDFSFSIGLDTPVGSTVTFVLDLTDQFLNTYRLTHDVQVQ